MQDPAMPPSDLEPRRKLARMRLAATLLLVAMVLLLAASFALPRGVWWVELWQAAALAGVVGGLADWYAVTAIFRHPLGVPLPHTAIIPREKTRIAGGLGRFIARHIFTETEVARVVAQLDLAAAARDWLNEPANARTAARGASMLLPALLGSLEDGRARKLASRLLPRLVAGAAPGLTARILGTLVEGGRHQEAFSFVLGRVKELLASQETAIRVAIETRVGEQGGRLAQAVAGPWVARKVLESINGELAKVEPDDSELRAAFDTWARGEITRIALEPERSREIASAIRGFLADPRLAGWTGDVWTRLRASIVADASDPNGRTVAALSEGFANLARFLDENPDARAKLNGVLGGLVAALAMQARPRIADFVSGVVLRWDGDDLADRLELQVGRELQWVRINGTILGALLGAGLYGVLTLAVGRIAH